MSISPVRILMWSGPRNISTALMRAWGNRPDTVVWDEPFYAHYLEETGVDHPGREEVIAAHQPDWREVVQRILGPVPEGKRIFYQKQMAHHLLPHIETGFVRGSTNCFLIRRPREMLTSLMHFLPKPRLEDTGLPQQVKLFREIRRFTGCVPPVIDSRDILEDPRRLLTQLCEEVGIPFDDAMLSWPPGGRDTDGVWTKYWYTNVDKSTGFAPYRPKTDEVPNELQDVLQQCDALYEELYPYRLGQPGKVGGQWSVVSG